jgi:hypothetical protein
VRPQVADRGDGFTRLRIASKILNKQSQRADKCWSSSLEAGCGAKNLSIAFKSNSLYEMSQTASDLEGFFG